MPPSTAGPVRPQLSSASSMSLNPPRRESRTTDPLFTASRAAIPVRVSVKRAAPVPGYVL